MTRMENVIMTCLSGLHEGSVLLKDLSNPPRPNRTYMSEKPFLKIRRESYGSKTSWNYMVVNTLAEVLHNPP